MDGTDMILTAEHVTKAYPLPDGGTLPPCSYNRNTATIATVLLQGVLI